MTESRLANVNLVTGLETSKYMGLEMPPGAGFTTVTAVVPAFAMSEAGIDAVNCEPVTNVVVRGTPSQFTADAETNPVPFTVSVKLDPAGAAVIGTGGWLINGTGLVCASASVAPS